MISSELNFKETPYEQCEYRVRSHCLECIRVNVTLWHYNVKLHLRFEMCHFFPFYAYWRSRPIVSLLRLLPFSCLSEAYVRFWISWTRIVAFDLRRACSEVVTFTYIDRRVCSSTSFSVHKSRRGAEKMRASIIRLMERLRRIGLLPFRAFYNAIVFCI